MSAPYFQVILFSGLLLLAGCSEQPPSPREMAPQVTAPVPMYPVLPAPLLDSLAPLVTHIDFIFYHLKHSISLNEPNGIMTHLSHIAGPEEVPQDHGCKPVGRIFYMASGQTVLTGDLYFSGKCRFVLFLENEKPVYAARLNDQGVLFLTNAGVPL